MSIGFTGLYCIVAVILTPFGNSIKTQKGFTKVSKPKFRPHALAFDK